jgi:hypothetical protein
MDGATLNRLVDRELTSVRDPALLDVIRNLRVEPYVVERDWDYGAPGQQYPCWTVFEHQPSNTGVAYCEQGFGPAYPWGLVFLSGPHMNIGSDSGWFATIEDAVRESMAWEGDNPPDHEVA